MRPTLLVGVLVLLLGVGSTPVAVADLPEGRGALLPLQDRVGDAWLAELIETSLRRELEVHADLAETDSVRTVLRSLRVRDASNEGPDRLATLAQSLRAEWFFLATLHEARQGRVARRSDGGESSGEGLEDGGDTPQVVLSARVFRHDSKELSWAGFTAASGRDGERAFGLGVIESLEELTGRAVEVLVAEASSPREPGVRARLRRRWPGFLRSANGPSPPDRVAVIPMDSVANLASGASAEVATAALFASLDDYGFKTLLPGLVRTIRQENGLLGHGGASRSEWEALARDGGASWVATGTVETYRPGQGRVPDPWVAFSVRLLDTGDGRIDWLDGLERTGRNTASVFDRGRIYSTGSLTYQMMRSLLGGMRKGSASETTARGN